MERQYKNYAFISYKREDEKWAKWLQRKLESYKLPSVIRKESLSIPKYIRPVFRDKTDLSGGVLSEQLNNELVRSKYLIVICSPNSAQSVWVNKEVTTFIKEGRIEHVIPFIIAGTPHADNMEEECFPEALRNIPGEQELLGINVQEIGREKALVRLIAYMIGVSFDVLWQRYRRQEKSKRISLLVCVLLFMGLGAFYWDYTRATYKYYADYVDCWGVPKGIIELNEEQVARRHRSYKFEYRRIPLGEPNAYDWRLAKVSYTNSAGMPQEHEDLMHQERSSILLLEYSRETGTILRINHCNSIGRVLQRFDISGRDNVPATIVDIKGSLEEVESGFAPSNMTGHHGQSSKSSYETNRSNIKRYAYDRDENGYIIRQTYHNSNLRDLSKSKAWDADGVSGMIFDLDSLGRRTRIRYLNENYMEFSVNGISGWMLQYDERGVISTYITVDINGQPILNEDLWATWCTISDSDGNIKEEHVYDENGNPCMRKAGFSKRGYVYNEHGNMLGAAFFAPDLTPCYDKNSRVFAHEFEYDSHGNIVLERFRDENGNACYGSEGYAMKKMEYNSSGQIVKIDYYDVYERPCFIGKGQYSTVIYEYDSSGNLIKETLFKLLKYEKLQKWLHLTIPATDDYGVHQYVTEFDSLNNVVRAYFLDENYQLYKHPDYGYAIIKFNYDSWGNRIGESYLDVNESPCLSQVTNVSSIQWVLDDNGNVIEEAYYGIDSTLCADENGCAVYISERDSRGRVIKKTFLDENRKPCVDRAGVSYCTMKYDLSSNPIEIALFDLKGKPCECSNGYAILRKKYDYRGNLIEETCYDHKGKLCKNIHGYAKSVMTYDNRCNEIEQAFFDENGLMCSELKGGSAKICYKYDIYDNCIETSYWGVNGNLFVNKVNNVAKYTTQYDRRGHVIEQAYFNADGLPYMPTGEFAKWIAEYNDWGLLKRYSQYDDNGIMVKDSIYDTKAIFYFRGDSIGEVSLE